MDLHHFNIAALTPDVKPPILLSTKALKLQRYTTIASDGSFTWDGLNGNVIKGHMGTYLIKISSITANGKMESFKQTCVFTAKLN